MIDHVSLAVKNFEQSQAFYDQTLEILGYHPVMSFCHDGAHLAGYGKNGKPDFWISFSKKHARPGETIGKAQGFHVAFLAPSVESIHAWHKKCLELGGQDNGAPGPRPQYYPGYYGGFIIDPNGWRIEAAIHRGLNVQDGEQEGMPTSPLQKTDR